VASELSKSAGFITLFSYIQKFLLPTLEGMAWMPWRPILLCIGGLTSHADLARFMAIQHALMPLVQSAPKACKQQQLYGAVGTLQQCW
jgi:hypothetical protein